MPILIDGHNLIGSGAFADIRLDQEDDEAQLVARLKVWKSRYPGQFIVVFDRGISHGEDLGLSGAGVKVVFAANPAEADILIRHRLRRPAKGLILVTGDDALRRVAQEHNVEVWSGQEFVGRMTLIESAVPEAGTEAHVKLSGAEVEEWMSLFAQAKGPPARRQKHRLPVRQPAPQRRPVDPGRRARKSKKKGRR